MTEKNDLQGAMNEIEWCEYHEEEVTWGNANRHRYCSYSGDISHWIRVSLDQEETPKEAMSLDDGLVCEGEPYD
jgi:hypothetical protein